MFYCSNNFVIFDDKRSSIDAMRRENQAIQRNQFDAEKKVAIADTSIRNLQRTIGQIQEEKLQRQAQLQQLETEKKEKEELEQMIHDTHIKRAK